MLHETLPHRAFRCFFNCIAFVDYEVIRQPCAHATNAQKETMEGE